MTDETTDLWVFAYGSLMWKPGFDFAERRRATLPGYVRRFCLDSITYRGTPEFPGLVLALDEEPGRHCEGVAYRVVRENRREVHEYLRARELITYSYLEAFLPIRIGDDTEVPALCYIMDRSHAQYRGGLSPDDQADVIARAHGPAGSNVEYLQNTMTHLLDMSVTDDEMNLIHALVKKRLGD
ncbi:MAG: gamma-glutamylcyclotransferase [Pseudomonadota bacterium]